MELRALRCFVEVVQRQSFTAAAQALFVTQPTVSKMLQSLEDELGMPLLRRDAATRKRQVRPTDAGRLVLARAQEMLALQTALESDLAALGDLRRGELTIGIPPLGATLLTAAISDFRKRWPGIELKLMESGSRALETALRAGELEVGVLLAPVDDDFDSIAVCDYPLCLVAARGSRWAGRASVALADLAGEPFLLFGETFMLNDVIGRACRAAGFVPTIAGRSSQWDFLAEMVGHGMGIALLPQPYGERLDGRRFVSVPVTDPALRWRLVLAWRRAAHLSRAAQAWLTHARGHWAPPA